MTAADIFKMPADYTAPPLHLVSACHGADTFNATAEFGEKPLVMDFCNACKQPCMVVDAEQWRRAH